MRCALFGKRGAVFLKGAWQAVRNRRNKMLNNGI